jgi:DUF2934 family protein
MPRTTRNQEAGTAVADKDPAAAETAGKTPPEPAQKEARDGASPAAPPAYDDIARRAYELYQQRGAADGQEVDDWLRAEAELRDGPGRRDDEL